MRTHPTAIADVVLLEPRVLADERGSFMETWQLRKLADVGIHSNFVQANQSVSKQWVLRGLHYQIQQPQGKLLRVTMGAIFDVAVDMRRSSPTFGQHVAATLSAENARMLWVPPGFAHGFLALNPHTEVSYYCTDYYAPDYERALIWNDPALKIEWPLPAGVTPVLNAKDRAARNFANCEYFA